MPRAEVGGQDGAGAGRTRQIADRIPWHARHGGRGQQRLGQSGDEDGVGEARALPHLAGSRNLRVQEFAEHGSAPGCSGADAGWANIAINILPTLGQPTFGCRLASDGVDRGWAITFVSLLWYIAQAGDPSVAASVLREHDDLVASGKRPHRVTEFFAGSGQGSLRLDMEKHAAGQGMSERLRCEVRSYQLCKVDDTWAEAVHRDVSGFGQRSSAAKVPYIAASHRMEQTMASVDRMRPDEVMQFHECMRKYKAIGQVKPCRGKALRAVRKKVSDLVGQVYRFDSSACRDWGAELGCAVKFLEDRPAKRRSVAERLQLEYLDCAVSDGEVLSLPDVSNAILDQAKGAPLADLPIVLHQGPVSANSFFIIVDKAAGRKKQLRTAATSEQHAMAKLVSLQRMTWWPVGGHQEEAQVVVFHDGFPQIVDLLSLASWPVLRGGLRKWQTAESQVAGCMALSGPEVVSAPSGWRRDDAPAICLLEDLAHAGWTRGQPPLEHTLASSKTFAVKDPIASKAYLRCLLGLADLVSEDKMPCLRSDQPATYYSCVLASDQPQTVPCGQSPAEYKRLLALPPAEALLLLQNDDQQQPILASPASSDEVELLPSLVDRARRAVALGRGRGRGRGAGGRRRQLVLDDDWDALVLAAPVPAAPTEAETPAQSIEGPPAAAGSGAASSSDPAPPASGSALVAVGPAQDIGSQVGRGRAWALLEGVEVHEEAHGVFGTPGSYRRLVVRCQHHSAKNAACRKTRSFGVRSAGQSGLGDEEPYAFLGCWLQAHARFDDSAAHKRFAPSAAQVLAYATEHGFVAGGA